MTVWILCLLSRHEDDEMNVFDLRNELVGEYGNYTASFINIRYEPLRSRVESEMARGALWPDPLLQLNPAYEPGGTVEELVRKGVLHSECAKIFRRKKDNSDRGTTLQLYQHQVEAINLARRNEPYVVTTGTGSGKSLTYIIPIVEHVLQRGSGRGIQAIIIYPMNALANSQFDELEKYLQRGYLQDQPPVTYARYTGQEGIEERSRIIANPPDILLTNYVMLELLLTRRPEQKLIAAARDLKFLVLDELHTYRGRQGADVAMLVRRCRQAFSGERMTCVGTSATMATDGTRAERRAAVARVASSLFGQSVGPDQVVDETLTRMTAVRDFATDAERGAIADATARAADDAGESPIPFEALIGNPLSSWIESTFGLAKEPDTDRLRRAQPQAADGPLGAAVALARLAQVSQEIASKAIRHTLELGARVLNPATGLPTFAFRLHQFVTRGDTVWATLDPIDSWHVSLRGQQFMPGDRSRILLPLCFCKDCGHHFYRVDRVIEGDSFSIQARTRFEITKDPTVDEHRSVESGYLFQPEDSARAWPSDPAAAFERLPPDWCETTGARLKLRRNRRDDCPELLFLDTSGCNSPTGNQFLFLKAPFAFCPHCDVAYPKRERNDISKLRTLGVDSRSTATTILALNVVQQLKKSEALDPEAKKLLSFTDNRQDASLQAGHFNDFVEVSLVRSGLVSALKHAGAEGLRFGNLAQSVYNALGLPFHQFSANPDARFAQKQNIESVFRKSIAFRIYRDLLRGWRVASPNLEQCGLLRFGYQSLDEFCTAEDVWESTHPLLRDAKPEKRFAVCTVLLDSFRRALAIKAEELTKEWLEQTVREADVYLIDDWTLGESVLKAHSMPVVWPRSLTDADEGEDIPISSASKFGSYLKRQSVLGHAGPLSTQDTDLLIANLFGVLDGQYIFEAHEPRTPNGPKGYRLGCQSMVWMLGDGKPVVDPLRQEREGTEGTAANSFFTKFYSNFASLRELINAREHTAQVGAEERKIREDLFKKGELPVLFCSPTMELGVDIAQLNVVNMRNMPPTPANYAQRSGRAGRGGQPALVYTYCSGYSPHDQYFFNKPEAMVSGSVKPPRIELANESLLRAHIHAIWLGETGADLKKTLADILVVSSDDLTLPIQPEVHEQLSNTDATTSAIRKAELLVAPIRLDLKDASWFHDGWIDATVRGAVDSFDRACNRWRDLFRAAVTQRLMQNRIIGDQGRSEFDQRLAKSLRQQAEAQIDLLTRTVGIGEGDFYSYRYFASEGFLPGYSFPRLPVSAFVPARRGSVGDHQYLNRPRFLAISEFGPQAIIYHEGARYRIHRAGVAPDSDGAGPAFRAMKTCGECGYCHADQDLSQVHNCRRCNVPLEGEFEYPNLVRMQNVSARRIERITSDEEERQRQGYDVRAYYAFPQVGGEPNSRKATFSDDLGSLAQLEYGDSATLWRVNLGWSRRQNRTEHGFFLDFEKGEWVSRDAAEVEAGAVAARPNAKRVIPFVDDTKNALVFTPECPIDEPAFMPSLAAALHRGIQHVFQVEGNEIAIDSLPSPQRRNHLLLYEATEGGAGVLRQLVEDKYALGRVARAALELCHFDADTGEDIGLKYKDGCEAGCYDCLLNFGNQLDHARIDRKAIAPYLQKLMRAIGEVGVAPPSRDDPWQALYSLCDSQLEKKFLDLLRARGFCRPNKAQYWIPERYSRPDFYYTEGSVCVFIDGPPHDDPAQAVADTSVREALVRDGYKVVVFHHQLTDWLAVVRANSQIFGIEGATAGANQ
jgi:superfamily II DNA/RNA helicase